MSVVVFYFSVNVFFPFEAHFTVECPVTAGAQRLHLEIGLRWDAKPRPSMRTTPINKPPQDGRSPKVSKVAFSCANCGREVSLPASGTMNRNHCPFCLFSLHVAESRRQDDRNSTCRQLMEPIAISAQKDGEWSLVHRCVGCGNIKTNRIAGDDDALALLCIALRALEHLPFPLDQVLFEARAKAVDPVSKGKPA